MTEPDPRKVRFRLHGFVCERGCMRSGTLGWQTFTQIFNQREGDCRYAVVEDHEGRILLWDFFSDEVLFGHAPPVTPTMVFEDPDQAMMAATLLWRDE